MNWRKVILVPAVPAIVLAVGLWSRQVSRRTLEAQASAAEERLPRARVATAVADDGQRTITLPGDLVPDHQALIYARATGYVASWKTDIGALVRAGDVLADLDTPDLDQQLAQARATLDQKKAALEQAVANRDYARVTATRQDTLVAQSLVSKQADDQANAQREVAEANVHAAQADLEAARANVRQLVQLVQFGHVVAPFDGRITQRMIDVGSLVLAGGSSGAQPLFEIQSSDPIRTFIHVPQAYAVGIEAGQTADVALREMPGRSLRGRVTRTSGALDPAARTLDVEIDIPNPTGDLLGGTYAEVTLDVARSHRVVKVPASAVITDAAGNHVAVVDPAGVVHLVSVLRGADEGSQVDIASGLQGGERVLVNPGADVQDGLRVIATT